MSKIRINRRHFMASAAMTAVPFRASAEAQMVLQPAEVSTRIGDKTSKMIGYNGSLPGPTIRVTQNDTVRVRLKNGLDEGTLVHWHGIRVPNAMDGVSILTQDVISPGEIFDYKYTVPDAGTYWYHAHYLSIEQVSRGLFGALIVDENTPPDVDHDIVAMTFDALLGTDGRFDPVYYQAHYATGGRLGNYRRLFLSDATIKTGQRIRLRLINPSVDRVFVLHIDGLDGAVVALDGMPLDSTRPMAALTLAPGQRADVIGDVTRNITVSDIGDGSAIVLGEMVATQGTVPRTSPIPLLPKAQIPALGRVSQSATLVMQGGAAGSDHAGYGTWALNDVTGLGRTPLLTANQGDTVQITLFNNTAFDHGIHLHGMHFWETGPAGNPTILRDTTLVRAGQSQDILCVLDNPGAWLLHCHMLSHSADGMATWIRVN